MNDFKRFENIIFEMNFSHVIRKSMFCCVLCMKNKMIVKFSKRKQNFVFEINECMNFDLKNFISFMTFENYNYFALITNKTIDYT